MNFDYCESIHESRSVSVHVILHPNRTVRVDVKSTCYNKDKWETPSIVISDIYFNLEEFKKINYAVIQCYDEFIKRYGNQNNR